jgi:hypothetical protein
VIVAIKGDPTAPITVHISGVTVDANGVDATAGVVFLDAQGSVNRSQVTGLAIDESKNGYQVPGGFRSNDYGVGIAMVTRKKPPKNEPNTGPTRTLTIDHTRIDTYNAVGVLVDGSTGYYVPTQTTPLVASGSTTARSSRTRRSPGATRATPTTTSPRAARPIPTSAASSSATASRRAAAPPASGPRSRSTSGRTSARTACG